MLKVNCSGDSPTSVSVWQGRLSFHTHQARASKHKKKNKEKQNASDAIDKLLIH